MKVTAKERFVKAFRQKFCTSPTSYLMGRTKGKEIQNFIVCNLCVAVVLFLIVGFSPPGIAQDVPNAKGIILFVHGLGGDEDTFSTWYPVIEADQQLKSYNISYKTLVYPTGFWERSQAQS